MIHLFVKSIKRVETTSSNSTNTGKTPVTDFTCVQPQVVPQMKTLQSDEHHQKDQQSYTHGQPCCDCWRDGEIPLPNACANCGLCLDCFDFCCSPCRCCVLLCCSG